MLNKYKKIIELNKMSPFGVMVNVLDYDIVISEFELHSCNYYNFRIKTLGKVGIPSSLPDRG